MLYFLVTTSIFNDNIDRKNQYMAGIGKLNELCEKHLKNYKIIIIENNGVRKTFLDKLNFEIFYTNNNQINTTNKGYKELRDIIDCINKYDIKNDDFIVKMTGRYILTDNSKFVETLKNINYDCLIRYGSYLNPVNYKMKDCITGLIGMRCSFIKKIIFPETKECVEWKWAEATYLIEDKNIVLLDELGIYICPGSNDYFLV